MKKRCEFSPRTQPLELNCDRSGRPGKLVDRRCVIGAVREILGSITGAVHLIHGPIGCALSSSNGIECANTAEIIQYSTDLKERDIIFGGEKRLERAIREVIAARSPSAVFVYGTCTASLIGDDMASVCKNAEKIHEIPVIFVECKGYKSVNHTCLAAPYEAIFKLIGLRSSSEKNNVKSINLLGEFGASSDVAGYFHRIGIEQVISITGNVSVEQLKSAHLSSLNLVQRSRPMAHLARRMNEVYGVPALGASFLGIASTSCAIIEAAEFFDDPEIARKAQDLVTSEITAITPIIEARRKQFEGARAILNAGGAYKTAPLVKALREIGIETHAVSLRAVQEEERGIIEAVIPKNCIVVEDATPTELAKLAREIRSDLVIGGIDDGLVCRKYAVPFCLHNQQTSSNQEGFTGITRLANDIHSVLFNPIWRIARARLDAKGDLWSSL